MNRGEPVLTSCSYFCRPDEGRGYLEAHITTGSTLWRVSPCVGKVLVDDVPCEYTRQSHNHRFECCPYTRVQPYRSVKHHNARLEEPMNLATCAVFRLFSKGKFQSTIALACLSYDAVYTCMQTRNATCGHHDCRT